MHVLRKNLYSSILLWLLLLVPFSMNAQRISIHHPQLQFLFEDSLLQRSNYHSALRPMGIQNDHLLDVFNTPNTIKNRKFLLTSVIDANAGYYFNEKNFSYRFGQGGFLAGSLGKRVGFELSTVLYEQKFTGESYSIDSLSLVPRNNNYLWGKNESAGYLNVRGNIWWKANRWLTFTAGNDKHFIGDGERSILLSENAAAYPFFQTRLNVWKVNYMHQVMFMKDVVPGIKDKRFDKYASMHILSLNATKKLNFYVFEAVIWRKQDSVRHRGFDVHYLNPFLFFRPVEFNMGSPDNVFMGIGGKYLFGKHTMVYSQFMLDEFKIKEIKAQRGWWATKYGFQAGFKTYSLFPNTKSMFLLEYNQVRPFTYAHTNSLQNYGYLNEPLAHPQGSNFREVLSVLRLQKKTNWLIEIKANYLYYGTDPFEANYGSDIYKGQYTHTHEYGNKIGQGVLNHVMVGELSIYRMLNPKWRLAVFSTLNITLHREAGINHLSPMVSVGLNTLLYE